jgi:hypothetical protein
MLLLSRRIRWPELLTEYIRNNNYAYIQNFSWKTLRGKILVKLSEIGCHGVDWIQLAPEHGLVIGFCEYDNKSSGIG